MARSSKIFRHQHETDGTSLSKYFCRFYSKGKPTCFKNICASSSYLTPCFQPTSTNRPFKHSWEGKRTSKDSFFGGQCFNSALLGREQISEPGNSLRKF